MSVLLLFSGQHRVAVGQAVEADVAQPLSFPIARPTSDITPGGWFSYPGFSQPLWQQIDEATADDTDGASISLSFGSDTFECGLSAVPDPNTGTGHVISIRTSDNSGASGQFTVALKQGATTIASFFAGDGSSSFVTTTYTLTSAEANAITDYSALSVAVTGSDIIGFTDLKVSWLQFRVPNPPASGHTISVGQPLEIDVSQSVAHRKIRIVGEPIETDTAQALSRQKIRSLGEATEADISQPVGHSKRRTLGQSLETNTSQPVTKAKVRTLGEASETDAARSVGHFRIRTLGGATEADTAQSVARAKARQVGQSTETDTAQTLHAVKQRALGEAQEIDVAQSVTRAGTAHTVAVGQASEADFTQALTGRKLFTVGETEETDVAQALVASAKHIFVGTAAEFSTALGVSQLVVQVGGPSRHQHIRFTAVREVDFELPSHTLFAGVGAVSPVADAAAAFVGHRMHAGIGRAGGAPSANGYARLKGQGLLSMVGRIRGSADSDWLLRSTSARVVSRSISARGEASSVVSGCAARSGVGGVRPTGVRNPTDEELAVLVYELTKKA